MKIDPAATDAINRIITQNHESIRTTRIRY